MRVLVTNDDGIESQGLHALAGAISAQGHDAMVVAPAGDCSGYGAAIGPLHLSGQVAFERVSIDGLAGVESVAVDGPPALAVLAACLGGFGSRPQVVVSGVNAGANTGRAVLHSGTVGAALTAVNLAVPAMAVSQAVGGTYHWDTAADAAVAVLPWVAAQRAPLVLNLNVPNVPAEDVVGVAPARLDVGGVVQAVMEEAGTGLLQMRPSAAREPAPGTDTSLLAGGFVTLTAIPAMRTAQAPLEGPAVLLRAALERGAGRVA